MIRSFSNVPAFKREIDVINGKTLDESFEPVKKDYSFRMLGDNCYTVKCKRLMIGKTNTKVRAREICLRHFLKQQYVKLEYVPDGYVIQRSKNFFMIFKKMEVGLKYLYKCKTFEDALLSVHYHMVFE